MGLLTQNSDLRQGNIWGWTLPAHVVRMEDGTKFNTCPSAGACGAFCYAKSGTYMFSNVIKAHLENLELVLKRLPEFIEIMDAEIKGKRLKDGYIRIHDAGDFFSREYMLAWFEIANRNPEVNFYTYTKEVLMFKDAKAEGILPNNLTTIYSFGGRQDKHIDREVDRHSDVFYSYHVLLRAGYYKMGEDDKQAAINPNHKIGLFRNNIRHNVIKQGRKNFSEWQNNGK